MHRIFTTSVASVYPLDLAKVERTHRTQAELDARDAAGNTALMLAAAAGDHRVAAALRACGADLDLRDANGRKAVDLAAIHGHSAVLVCLMRGGCGG